MLHALRSSLTRTLALSTTTTTASFTTAHTQVAAQAAAQAATTDGLAAHVAEHGYGVVPGFLSQAVLDSAMAEFSRLVEVFDPESHPLTRFSTRDHNELHGSDAYFLGSGDKIRYFLEEDAQVDSGSDPRGWINKIGHALHELNPVFAGLSWDPRVKDLVLDSGLLVDPVILQSMYITKSPRIGGAVTSHHDSAFLIDEPRSVMGLWFALEDATVQNGCLWALPGSHKTPAVARFARDPDNPTATVMTGEFPAFDEDTFVPLEVEAGSVVILHGSLLHASKANTSPKSRHAYTLHLKERASAWDPANWLQSELPFHGWEAVPTTFTDS